MIILDYPLQSLRESRWFKLICGASFQHLPAIRNLTLAYSLAGADCIDVAADQAVIAAARNGLEAMQHLYHRHGRNHTRNFQSSPWLMISVNDGDDPHFRKATFDPVQCPSDCHRPCESICPADAIVFTDAEKPHTFSEMVRVSQNIQSNEIPPSGVVFDRCYGCGRCLPVCPIQHIQTQSHQISTNELVASLLPEVDALEIHTQVGRSPHFRDLWHCLRPHIHHLKLIAISCPDGDGFVEYLRSLHNIMTDNGTTPLTSALVWQTDGRPMSGDIGNGTTHATVRLAQKAIAADLPGFVQLAGGTNAYTVPLLRSCNLLTHSSVAGVAYGSYARKVLTPVLDALEHRQTPNTSLFLESVPDLLHEAVQLAYTLVSQVKQPLPEVDPPPLVI
ncbi:MAG: 4Fe-4S ferredoxin [Merismopedia sp. SIO2A8]|nr:4Fe-4S ferredoxin [Merismopedia sp. SIO2A8]